MSCPEAPSLTRSAANGLFWYKGTIANVSRLSYNGGVVQGNKSTVKGGEKNAVSAA